MADRSRFRAGWIHRAQRPEGVGLVVVPPFGFEEVCAHRPLRALAVAAAAAGVTTVRFDLDGTGDSAGSDLEGGRVAAWLASIDDACDLARAAGCDRVVLCGVRLGSALAALAAARRHDVAGFIAIAGAPKVKALLRQLHALQMQLELVPPPEGEPLAGDVEVKDETVGFALTPETRAELAAIDLVARGERPAPRVLLVDRDDQKGNDDWAAALRAQGADVAVVRPRGYLEMMADPHLAKPPDDIIDEVVKFARAVPALADAPAGGAVWTSERVDTADFSEELVRVDGLMPGVATRPPAGVPTTRALILFSAGGTHHIGPNRMYVTLARRLARAGVACVRLDQSGIGDADVRPGEPDNVVYTEVAHRDLAAAVAWVRRAVPGKLAIAGLCSGAFHALRAALDGDGVDLAIPINSPFFHYEPGKPLDFEATAAAKESVRYKRAMSEGDSWKKLLRGDVDMRHAARVVTRRARDTATAFAKELARRARLPLPHDLATQLRAYAERGGAIRFVFADEDPGKLLLEQQAGSTLPRLVASDRVAILAIAGADHTFTARWTQRRVLAEIERLVTSHA